ncbi:hypothetical protein EJ02DRAFT_47589 [Clathrospora elynae]|uniref:Uncharacterized protein n=1 Tax=Clathrospora elynae TaxID=706981 RepID=A0A6A5SGX9_9PLEO|nr:hypothetical protein EJ02DRAFT_47589 [Clathrospora elynae]
MSVTWPAFIFPPPLPGSAFSPKPSNHQHGNVHWYLESALQNQSNYPVDGFGPSSTSIRVNDFIAPRWVEPEGTQSAFSEWVYALELWCLVCLPTKGGRERWGNGEAGFPWCNNDTSNATDTSSRADSVLYIPRGGSDLTMRVPGPNLTETTQGDKSRWENTTLACTIAMHLGQEKTGSGAWERPMALSQLFIVSNKPRGGALEYPQSPPYMYNETYPLGTPSKTADERWDEFFPSGFPLPSSVPTPHICGSTRYKNCRHDGWYGWSVGKRFGLIFGALVGFLLIAYMLYRHCGGAKLEWVKVREKKKPILLSELRAQQRRDEQAAAERASTGQGNGSERQYAEEQTAAVDEPLPTYHETVNDQERMLATYAIRRDNAAAAALPPSYPPPAADVISPAPALYSPPSFSNPPFPSDLISSSPLPPIPSYPPPASATYHPPPQAR